MNKLQNTPQVEGWGGGGEGEPPFLYTGKASAHGVRGASPFLRYVEKLQNTPQSVGEG